MLAARGVSLGLGKIKLNELPFNDRATLSRLQRAKSSKKNAEPKIHIKKHVDRKTLWIACRTVLSGIAIMVVGLTMTVLGYFDRELATASIVNATTGVNYAVLDSSLRFKLHAMQYIGPVLMGGGLFMLICACVITLESRDRHTQIIQQEASEQMRKVLSQKQQQISNGKSPKKFSPRSTAPLLKKTSDQRAADTYSCPPSNSSKAKSADTERVPIAKGALKHQAASSSLSDNTSAFASTLPLQSSIDLPSTTCSNNQHHEGVGRQSNRRRVELPQSPGRASTPESRVNRPSPKGQAPIVKVESLSTSLMTSPSNSPRVQAAASQEDAR